MKKTKILVIDDDPMMLDLARYQLQSHGCEVTTAETGEEGLKLSIDQHSDIVLTDLQLPDIDGIELVRKLKEALPETEIIMITGYSSVTGAIEAIRAGAFYFIKFSGYPVNKFLIHKRNQFLRLKASSSLFFT